MNFSRRRWRHLRAFPGGNVKSTGLPRRARVGRGFKATRAAAYASAQEHEQNHERQSGQRGHTGKPEERFRPFHVFIVDPGSPLSLSLLGRKRGPVSRARQGFFVKKMRVNGRSDCGQAKPRSRLILPRLDLPQEGQVDHSAGAIPLARGKNGQPGRGGARPVRLDNHGSNAPVRTSARKAGTGGRSPPACRQAGRSRPVWPCHPD